MGWPAIWPTACQLSGLIARAVGLLPVFWPCHINLRLVACVVLASAQVRYCLSGHARMLLRLYSF